MMFHNDNLQLRRINCDLVESQDQVRRHKDSLESKSRLIHDCTERERQANVNCKEEKEKTRNLRDEVSKFDNIIMSNICIVKLILYFFNGNILYHKINCDG